MTWSDSPRGRRAVAWCVPCLALLGACGPGNGEDAFAAREPLPSCGEVTARPDLGEGEPKAELTEAFACLDAASARGEGAELLVRSLTVEGDPIVEYHRVGPGIDGLEIYVDGTQDTFGERIWTYRSCPDTVTAAEPLGCPGEAVPAAG
ncbi:MULTISPECIES: hypothetical protein [unclassified Isoptericola]|uniref:hypothetical protein n=1 Tax=unclassified Isoptericola TaxID=2623355 RepID=UPI0036616767